MCQGGPYQALSFLPTRVRFSTHCISEFGETLVLNGVEDNLVATPHHGPSFFADLNARVAALTGGARPAIETRFYAGVGHRPSWVNRDAAEWLNARLRFPDWRGEPIDSLGETHIGVWAAATGARINHGYETEKTEAGVQAVGRNFPAPPPQRAGRVPEAEWSANLYAWQGWAQRTLKAEGLSDPVPTPAKLP